MGRRPPDGSLEEAGRRLVERLGGHWGGGRGMCRCPAHDDRTPSLSVRTGRSRLLLHCFAGCDAGAILRALRSAGLPGHAAGRGDPRLSPDTRGPAIRLWCAARVLGGSAGGAYLLARSLAYRGEELRFLHRTPDGPGPATRFRPALIAAVRDEHGLVAVHRTFLRRPGGAAPPVVLHRAALGPLGSGAVRLGGVAPRLGLAEGIETALSASRLFDIPCWAVLGTERFAKIDLPPEVREVVLFLDNDAGGTRAEALARERFADLAIEARRPRLAGADWNDILRAGEERGRPGADPELRWCGAGPETCHGHAALSSPARTTRPRPRRAPPS